MHTTTENFVISRLRRVLPQIAVTNIRIYILYMKVCSQVRRGCSWQENMKEDIG